MIVGNLKSANNYFLSADERYTARFRIPVESKVPTLYVWADGGTAGAGSQVVRAVIYDNLGNLAAYGDEITVAKGQALGWVPLTFTGRYPNGGPLLAAGYYYMGVHGGPTGAVIRLYQTATRWNKSVEPSMESGAALSWHSDSDGSIVANALARSQVWAARGLTSLYFKQTKDATVTSRTFLLRTALGTSGMSVPITTTASVKISANLISNLATGVGVRISWYNGATPLSSSTGTLVTGTGLKTLTLLGATVPATTTNFTIGLYGTSIISGEVLEGYLDEIVVEPGNSATYFDGDQEGFLWMGVPGYSASASGRYDGDTYSDGPAATLGVSQQGMGRLALYAMLIPAFAPPATVSDREIAALPVPAATAFFSTDTGPDTDTAIRASCGWHGTQFAEEKGAYAIVKLDGPLTDYVGERVKVQYEDRVTYAYVYDERDIAEDISLTRRGFLDLDVAPVDELEVTVTAMGASA